MEIQNKHIILCDDDVNLSTVLADYLSSRGFLVDNVHSGADVLEKFQHEHFDVLILDVSMPHMNGFQVLTTLRSRDIDIPVIFLTERSSREDIIRGFELGCDDYVTKPFSMDILICRINAILRRVMSKENRETIFTFSGKEFDSVRQIFDGKHLSAKENELLLLLARNKNQIVARNVILNQIWQENTYFASRSLSVYVNHLRKILEDTSVTILGLHGKGYKLVEG